MILCQSISNLKDHFVNDLKAKLDAVAIDEIDKAEIEMIIEDIKTYVMGAQNEYATTQHAIGMELIFKGWVVKNWFDVQQKQRFTTGKVNKIIVKQSMVFYLKAWKNRNDIMHNSGRYREHVIDWHKRLIKEIEKGNKPSIRKYVRMQRLELDKSDTGYI